MTPSPVISLLVFGCVFGAALLGMAVRRRLPAEHLGSDTKDVVKLAMGLVATMSALVLGLLTSSAQNTFRTWDAEVKESAADIILLDRTLAHLGPSTADIRAQLRAVVAARLAQTWPEHGAAAAKLDEAVKTSTVESIEEAIRNLPVQGDAQHTLQSQALSLCNHLEATRWLLFAQSDSGIPTPFLVVLIFWLSALAISFGLFAPWNTTVVAALLFCSLAVAASVFLILEMSTPLSGLLKISGAPYQYALAHLGL
ncbi:MAG: hypothetical protein U0802_11580 [Candidatus Binatia bacterium]